MLGLLVVAGAGAAGYVLGAKAGRGRYEEIVSKTNELVGQDRMEKVRSAGQSAAAKAGQVIDQVKTKAR